MSSHHTSALPVLPLRDLIFFPGIAAHIFVGRQASIAALMASVGKEGTLLLLLQKEMETDEPTPEDLYTIGVRAKVKQMLKLPDDTVKILIESEARISASNLHTENGVLWADFSEVRETDGDADVVADMTRALPGLLLDFGKKTGSVSSDAVEAASSAKTPGFAADVVAMNVPTLTPKDRQEILEIATISERLERVCALIVKAIATVDADAQVQKRVKEQMESNQRQFYLNEQMKAIRKELGDDEAATNELDVLADKIKKTAFTEEARARAESELKKLKAMPPMSQEGTVVRNYLDWLLTLPWDKPVAKAVSLEEVERALDAEHYGLDKVKERIVEYIAVQSRSEKIRGPILCLVGPPGVGKTSLAKSVADAVGRPFVRVALGGVRDEAEIRGHRRTYLGAIPGKILHAMKKAGARNPLILLDEIDKMTNDSRGDPAAALLEVLDPAQNAEFSDHYLDVGYDLSDVMFITTANSYEIPGPLLDRMEVITLSGYTEEEKIHIAKGHLVGRQSEENGIREGEIRIPEETFQLLVQRYTREAGVRSLERVIGTLMRKSVTDLVRGTEGPIVIDMEKAKTYLGPMPFRFGMTETENQIGLVNGLAYSSVGGDLLQLEALRMPGRGEIKATGRLGDVMKESVQAAASYVRSVSPEMGIHPHEFSSRDIHVHAPAGATPKDGPSAGLALVTAVVSAMTGIPVHRDVAMTGEVTIRGNALPIGGLKEKLLAALRGGIKTVIIPADNEKDLIEMPESVLKGLTIVPVSHVRDALKVALVREPTAIAWDEKKETGGFAQPIGFHNASQRLPT